MRLFEPGCGEGVKAQVHVALCGLLTLCCAYNTIAWMLRRDRHLGINAAVYGAGAVWEVQQIARHLEAQ